MTLLRVLAALAGLALLSACNVVQTTTPLFAAADEAGAPRLRPGVWQVFTSGDCTFDERQPIDKWPDCVGGAVVKPGEMIGYDKKDSGGVWEHDPFILAAGEPRIGQILMQETVGVGASAEASGGAAASASASGDGVSHFFGYAGVRPTKTDADGFITAVSFWPVMCGPPPPKNAKGEEVAMGTLKPLPGMVMKPGDATCTTASQAALRAAAKASEAWKEASPAARWLRDGDR